MKCAVHATCPALLALAAGLAGGESAPAVGWDVAALPAWVSPVPAQAVVVDGPAEIRWTPEPFAFMPGPSRRHIDYDAGDDTRDGLTPATAWKHHPWDPAAGGLAKAGAGQHTYVFKRGVVYRGSLTGTGSGTAEQPIRLTSDPAWGTGEAVISGAYGVRGGWQRVAADEAKRLGFPETSQAGLWAVALPGNEVPRALWTLAADGSRQRLPLARWPNWRIEHPYNHFTQWLRVEKVDSAFPRATLHAPKVLKGLDRRAFHGATVWVDNPVTSGEFSIMGPMPSGAFDYDPEAGSLRVERDHPARIPAVNSPFFVENLPRFLDEAGEWWFSTADRRLFLRLPGDADPNAVAIEAARYDVLIDLVGQRHVEISGLSLTGGNCPDLNATPDLKGYTAPTRTTQMASIRLTGDCRDITLRHLAIHDSAGSGIANIPTAATDVVSRIRISDSRFERLDNDAIYLVRGIPWRKTEAHPKGRLTHLEILRNRIEEIGLRTSEAQGGRGMELVGLEIGDIAGNIIKRTAAQAINIHGGRSGSSFIATDAADTPLVRIQVRHNHVTDTLLRKSDFGGIEFWGTGPAYVYGNISVNPVGYVAHRNVYHKNEAFYFDHGLKAYLFNNLGWSATGDDYYKGRMGAHFIHEVRTRYNQVFHNTACDFRISQSLSADFGDQQHYLGNLFINGAIANLCMWNIDQSQAVAYAGNLLAGPSENVYDRWKGDKFRTIEDLGARLATLPNHLSKDPGWVTDDEPVVDAAKRDFRPRDDSAAIDRGVKVFVPWGLSGTVGEWHFRLHPKDPATIVADDMYAQRWANSAEMHQLTPRGGPPKDGPGHVPGNELAGAGITADDYIDGPLEDWVRSALRFDGKRHLVLPEERLVRDFGRQAGKERETIPGRERKTVRMQDNNFLIEAVLRADAGGGRIAGKLDASAGYALELDGQGRPLLRLRSGGSEAVATAAVAVKDGRWHHVLAEVDRAAGRVTIHVNGRDGRAVLTGTLPAATASLDNPADFTVGQGFTGALDVLRVVRGTLADADTTIGELMAWQFNGPAGRDFAGRKPTGTHRDVGAIEHASVSGRKPIRYTPPPPPPPVAGSATVTDGRLNIAQPWGAVSVPKLSAPGSTIEIQVAFVTEAIDKRSTLGVDLIGWQGDTSLGVIAEGPRLAVEPGVTTPYVLKLTLPARAGMTAITARIFAGADAASARIRSEINLGLSKP